MLQAEGGPAQDVLLTHLREGRELRGARHTPHVGVAPFCVLYRFKQVF